MRHGLIQMVGLIVLGAAVGLAYNAVSPSGVPLKGGKEARLAQQGTRMMSLDEVQYYLQQGGTLMVDARSPEEFELGHIPGAVNLPEDAFDPYFTKFGTRLRKAKLLIVYCSGGSCGTSEAVAEKLLQRGFKEDRIAVFADGLPGWMRAKLPISRGSGS